MILVPFILHVKYWNYPATHKLFGSDTLSTAGFTGIFADSKTKRKRKKKKKENRKEKKIFFVLFRYISLSFYLKMLYITGPSVQLLTSLHLIQKNEWGSRRKLSGSFLPPLKLILHSWVGLDIVEIHNTRLLMDYLLSPLSLCYLSTAVF